MPWSIALGLRTILAANATSVAVGLDTFWVLTTVEAGLIRAKNRVNLCPKNAVDYGDRPRAGRLSIVPRRQQREPAMSLA
jgi:hypothetical protein